MFCLLSGCENSPPKKRTTLWYQFQSNFSLFRTWKLEPIPPLFTNVKCPKKYTRKVKKCFTNCETKNMIFGLSKLLSRSPLEKRLKVQSVQLSISCFTKQAVHHVITLLHLWQVAGSNFKLNNIPN
jgi:hypothetical protein